MLNKLGLISIGLALGLIFIALSRNPGTKDSRNPANLVGAPVPDDQLLTDIREQLQDLSARFTRLETRVGELSSSPDASAARQTSSRSNVTPGATRLLVQADQGMQVVAASQIPSQAELVEQLLSGGFSRQRADWISDRSEALVMEQIQARYESERTGKPLQIELDQQASLRRELGDAEYEQYLRAIGRATSVNVGGVIENSPSAQAGLQKGDRIVSYGGQRVFDFREILPLTIQGTRGESVTMEILRDGQPIRLFVPRGPLGATLSSDLAITR